MKIALAHNIFRPETRGGAEVVVDNIAYALKEKGDEVFILTVGRENKKEEVDGLTVYRVKPFNLFNFFDLNSKPAWLRLPWHLIDMFNDVQAWRLYKILELEKPEVVFTHSLKGLGYYLPWLLRIMKIKHIHTVHDMQLLDPSGLLKEGESWFKKVPLGVYRFFCRRLFGSPSVVIFPSKYIKKIYEERGFFPKSERKVLGNPIQLVKDLKKTEHDDFNLLFLGQVEEYKGIFELIKAFNNLGGKTGLIVAGEGKGLLEAQNKAQNALRIRFLGRLNKERLENEVWPEVDLLVNPSKVKESFGMVVIEAYAHGIPVLVSDNGALPELVKEGETGWVFKEGELMEKLKWCLENREVIRGMKEKCLEEARGYEMGEYIESIKSKVTSNR